MSLRRHLLAASLGAAACAEDAAPAIAPPGPATPAATSESPAAATATPISQGPHYRLAFADRAQHMIDVELTLPPAETDTRELWMATWTPGSYLLREYARQLEGLTAHDAAGTALAVTRKLRVLEHRLLRWADWLVPRRSVGAVQGGRHVPQVEADPVDRPDHEEAAAQR